MVDGVLRRLMRAARQDDGLPVNVIPAITRAGSGRNVDGKHRRVHFRERHLHAGVVYAGARDLSIRAPELGGEVGADWLRGDGHVVGHVANRHRRRSLLLAREGHGGGGRCTISNRLGVNCDFGGRAGSGGVLGADLCHIAGRAGGGVAPGVSVISKDKPTRTSLRIDGIIVAVVRLVVVAGHSRPVVGVVGNQGVAGDGGLIIRRSGCGCIRTGHFNRGDASRYSRISAAVVRTSNRIRRGFVHDQGDFPRLGRRIRLHRDRDGIGVFIAGGAGLRRYGHGQLRRADVHRRHGDAAAVDFGGDDVFVVNRSRQGLSFAKAGDGHRLRAAQRQQKLGDGVPFAVNQALLRSGGGGEDIAVLRCESGNLRLRILFTVRRARLVAPQANHRADKLILAYAGTHHAVPRGIVDVFRDLFDTVCAGFQHVVPVAVGVQDFEACLCQRGCGAYTVAAPAA